MTKKLKQQFEVMESETIGECLDRMKKEGYEPIRRIERPIFVEQGMKSKKEYIPIRQQIVFEGVLTKGEHS
ncbi:NETI motif-containing protein [bacterium LRH843]|nr:NETI motif-containing protein [bacterium LRH843]